ncbi:MAG: hypothetical protein O7F76_13005 [Planctomycetota bacterium]|nr:hypothetical protein [Planctomycetota bacterium]
MMDRHDERQREIESSERWLTQFETPEPREEAVAEAKRLVRRELHRRRPSAGAGRWRSWHGAVAAAAMIVVSIGVAWYSSNGIDDRVLVVSVPTDPSELDEDGDVLVVLTLDDAEMLALEAWSADLDGFDVGVVYDELVDAFDDSQIGDRQPAGTSRLDGSSAKEHEEVA